jgi:hypothetical protein
VVVGEGRFVRALELLQLGMGVRLHPARGEQGRALEDDRNAVLGANPVCEDFELERPYHPYHPVATQPSLEDARGALLCQLLEGSPEVLGPHRILRAHPLQ